MDLMIAPAASARSARLPILGWLADNRRMECMPDELDFDPIVPPKREANPQQQSQRKALRALSARWGETHSKRVDELARELCTGSPDAGSDERLIHRLAATSTAVSEMLGRAQLQLAERLERFVDNPKALLIVAKSLREVTSTQSSTLRSVQELLSAAATVRAQRRMVDHHAKRTWHEDIGGASLPPARRSPPARAETAN
jgi:hypothetical protein